MFRLIAVSSVCGFLAWSNVASAAEPMSAEACEAAGGVVATLIDGGSFCATDAAFAPVGDVEVKTQDVWVAGEGSLKSAAAWSEADSAACAAASGEPVQITADLIMCLPK